MSIRLFNHPIYRYLLLIPILFLLFNAIFFHYATKEINNALLKAKFGEVIYCLDVLAASLNHSDVDYEHEDCIRRAIEYIDNLYQVYAGGYKMIDDELVIITERYYETSVFEPLEYSELSELIKHQDQGTMVIGYTPEQQTYRELYLYFKWLPNVSAESKYLVIAGVSEYSVTVGVALWVSIGQWISTVVTFFLQLLLVALVARSGELC